MKAIFILFAIIQFAFSSPTCSYNNINLYGDNNAWMLLGQYGEISKTACRFNTSIRVQNIESFYITKADILIFTMISGEKYALEKNTMDFSSFNKILLQQINQSARQ
jgi:hypothetical protein